MVDASSCHTCGACCAQRPEHFKVYGQLPWYADLVKDDHKKIIKHLGKKKALRVIQDVGGGLVGEHWRTKTRLGEDKKFAACIALEGRPGVEVSCSIYSVRPTVCREFEPGSRVCLMARAELGLGPGGRDGLEDDGEGERGAKVSIEDLVEGRARRLRGSETWRKR